LELDILEADARALESLKLKDAAGEPVYPLELPADFDFWNILCTQAGHPALDLGVWHLGTPTRRNRKCAPSISFTRSSRNSASPRRCRKRRAAGTALRATTRLAFDRPSDLTSTLPKFGYRFTLLPSDMQRASLARVNGWAVTAQSTQTEAARALAGYLACQPVHAGWRSVQMPFDARIGDEYCYEALGQALVPRIEPKTARMAQFLDQQINLLARNSQQKTDELTRGSKRNIRATRSRPRSQAARPRPPDKNQARRWKPPRNCAGFS